MTGALPVPGRAGVIAGLFGDSTKFLALLFPNSLSSPAAPFPAQTSPPFNSAVKTSAFPLVCILHLVFTFLNPLTVYKLGLLSVFLHHGRFE